MGEVAWLRGVEGKDGTEEEKICTAYGCWIPKGSLRPQNRLKGEGGMWVVGHFYPKLSAQCVSGVSLGLLSVFFGENANNFHNKAGY